MRNLSQLPWNATLDASWRLFLAHGVDAVSMDTIAAEASVAKATVYAYFPDKRALFQEGVRREMVKIETTQRLGSPTSKDATIRDVLITFGVGIMGFLTSPAAVDFYGSLSGELRRDPELARMFYDAGPGQTLANLDAILSGPLVAGLAITNVRAASEMLIGMWQGMTSFQLMLGINHDDVVRSIPRRVEAGVDAFLRLVSRTGGAARALSPHRRRLAIGVFSHHERRTTVIILPPTTRCAACGGPAHHYARVPPATQEKKGRRAKVHAAPRNASGQDALLTDGKCMARHIGFPYSAEQVRLNARALADNGVDRLQVDKLLVADEPGTLAQGAVERETHRLYAA